MGNFLSNTPSSDNERLNIQEVVRNPGEFLGQVKDHLNSLVQHSAATEAAVYSLKAVICSVTDGVSDTARAGRGRAKSKGAGDWDQNRTQLLHSSQETASAIAKSMKMSVTAFKNFIDPFLDVMLDRAQNGSSDRAQAVQGEVMSADRDRATRQETSRLPALENDIQKLQEELRRMNERSNLPETQLTGKADQKGSEIDSVKQELSRVKDVCEILRTDIQTMQQDHTSQMDQNYRAQETDMKAVKEQLLQTQEDANAVKLGMTGRINELEYNFKTMEDEVLSPLKEKQASIEGQLETVDQKIARKSDQQETERVQEEQVNLQENYQNLEKEFKELQGDVVSPLRDNFATLESELIALRKQTKADRQEMESIAGDFNLLTEANSGLKGEINSIRNCLDRRQTELKSLGERLEGERDETRLELQSLQARVNDLDTKYMEILSRPEPRKSVAVQLYSPRRSDLTDLVVQELAAMLKSQFSEERTDLTATTVYTPQDVRDHQPVVAVCVISSRLGTDVSNGLRGLEMKRNIACIALHHQDLQNLPSLRSDRVLTAPEYRSLGAIIDMAFLKNKGVYSCDMNNTAITSLVSFIKAHNH